MGTKADEPLRGEAAWRAQKQRIAANNDAAYARGRKERAAQHAEASKRQRAAAKQESKNLPTQPKPR
jgi:hypothetical protein